MIASPAAWLGLAIDHRAVTSLEYAIIGGVIVTSILVGFNEFAAALSAKFVTIAGSIQ
jgi:Flp pilus assembly pilin Flp